MKATWLSNLLLRVASGLLVPFFALGYLSANQGDYADARGVDDATWATLMTWALACGALAMVCACAAWRIEARR